MKPVSRRRKHFIDYCFTKGYAFLNNSNINELNDNSIKDENIKQKFEDIKNKNNNNNNNNKPLSLRKIAINFNILSKKFRNLSNILIFISNIINWERDDKTLSFLFLFTWSCLNPHFFLLYPIIYMINYILYKYLIKHPIIEKPSMYINKYNKNKYNKLLLLNYWDDGLGPRLKSTNSNHIHGIFGFLWNENIDNNDNKYEEDNDNYDDIYREENVNEYVEQLDFNDIDKVLEIIDDNIHKDKTDNEEEKEKGEETNYNNFIMKTLFDIQIQTSEIIEHLNNIEIGISENCDFIDEKESTLLIFKLSILIFIGCFLGNYIPWKFIIIISIWISICMNHPNRKEFFKNLIDSSTATPTPTPRSTPTSHNIDKKSNHNSNDYVIINEPVFAREVQIFELEQQDIMKSNKYINLGFTNSLFNISEEIRLQRRKPECVDNILSIAPPVRRYEEEYDVVDYDDNSSSKQLHGPSWDFIHGEDWELCRDSGWLGGLPCCRELRTTKSAFAKDGWIYDVTGEFRRRKWTRKIVQHG